MKSKLLVTLSILALASSAYALKGHIAHDHNHDNGDYSHSFDEPIEHSGRTDKCGGHYNRSTGEYHYHSTPRC